MNDHLQSFQNEMRKFTDAISCYSGNDPLNLWFRFICWLEQNSGNDVENLFKTNLEKCLSIFEKYDNYKQDLRMVKLWIKYIDFLPNPIQIYQILYQRQVGTQCAAFYIGWAHYFNASNAFKQAESIYNLGLQLKAQPLEELEAAQQKFRYSVAQRMLYDDSSSKKRTISSLAEQRQQITSLSPQQHQHQYQQPNKRGRYEYEYSQSQSKYHDQTINNTNVDDYNQYNMNSHNSHHFSNKSSPQNHQIQMQKLQTEEEAQQQEQMQSQNYYENANSNDAGYVISSSLNYLYDNTTPSTYNMENSQSNQQVSTVTVQEIQQKQPPFTYEDGIQLPAHFICSAKNNTDQWLGALCLEEPYDQNRKCFYPKHIVYPGDGFEYSLEEIRARKHYAKIEEERENVRRIQEQEELERQRQFAEIEQQKQLQQQEPQQEYHKNYFRQYPENQHSLYQQQYGSDYEVYYYENQQQSVIVSAKHFQEQQYDNQSIQEYSQYQEPQYQENQLQTTELPIQEQQQHQQQNQYEEHNNVAEKSIPAFVAPVNIIPAEQETAKDEKNEELAVSDYESDEYEDAEEEEENEETDDEDSDGSENYTQPQVEIQSKHEVKSTSDDLEEQIEASTISFCSTTTSGISTQKKITIKFRKEKSTPVYPTSENNSGSSSPAIEDSFGKPQSTSKARKRKTAKFISAYVNENTTFMPSNNNSCSERPSESSNAVDDAELLLSFSNIHKNRHIESNESTTNSELNNSFGNISFAAIGQKSSANHNFSTSTCSTPIRSSISRTPLTTPISSYKFLKKHESNISLQNDDSIISYTADQNSFFQAENDEELQKRRLDRAIQTIESHYTKRDVDPFNSELCKAFLVKLNFPNRENTADYKIINQNLPKLSKNQVVPLGGYSYQIEKEVGRGSYGAVYRSVKTDDGSIVALKYQKPPNLWELYICTEVKNRLKHSDILPGFMSISAALIAPNASVLISEFSQYGSLLDVNNKIRQSTTKVMHESLVMHFSSQILNIVDYLHSINIIHADIKPDNFLLMTIPNPDSNVPSLRLIDFGCAIDMNLFEKGTEFRKIVQTDGFTCTEMLEGRPWTYQTDLFCVAGTIHVMLFGEYMQVVKKFENWEIKQKFPRYLKKHVWSEIIEKLLNIKDKDNLPNLQEMRKIINRELMGMENELNKQIRSLSNIMKRR